MKTGTSGLDAEITIRFTSDGQCPNMASVVVEGERMPDALARQFWLWLSQMKPADKVIEACWDDAEEESA